MAAPERTPEDFKARAVLRRRRFVLGRHPRPRRRRRDHAHPPREKTGEREPGHRIWAGQLDLGAAWKKISKDNNAYLSVKLDDISFGESVNAALVVIDGVHSLVWSPSTPKAD